MKFEQKLIAGTLIQRYKRFLADIKLNSGEIITAHCPNSGSMKTCKTPGWEVRISDSGNPARKYRHTWEMVHNGRCWIGINTSIPNKIAEEAVREGNISELNGFETIRREVKYGENSRIDLLLENPRQKCYVEVKNVTLVEEDGYYKFPDAVTERGRKHLKELMEMVKQGHRAVMLFVIQRSDGTVFKPAKDIDPQYAATLKQAFDAGVEILPYRAHVSPGEIKLTEKLEFRLD